ncbi:MAG: ABC transporter permease [Candidatus Aminicenantes bacterium]|nr:ABC transporter permease [Candidatus Aminicenantes bacterium]
MLLNYFKTNFRNLFKHKGYSLINISGLAIGMAACLLILLYVHDELSYDNYNEDADRIYRIAFSGHWGGRDFNVCAAPAPMAKVILETYPEIEEAVRFRDQGSFIVQYGDNATKESRIVFTDASFFNIFTVPLLKGDPQTALKEPNTLVLSRKTAQKYFGEENPIGKTLRLDNRTDYKVAGVFEEIPENSHFHYDILLSMESLSDSKNQIWLSMNYPTYIRLHEGTDYKTLEVKFEELIEKYVNPQMTAFMGTSVEEYAEQGEMLTEYFLQPLKSIHLHSNLLGELEPNSDTKYVLIFSAIAFFIIIIAAINFMNLSTACSAGRAKEVGIRKILGSFRKQLVGQFLTESMVLSVISMILALFLVRFTLIPFNKLSSKTLGMTDLSQISMIFIVFVVTIITGFLAGSYPAFFISAFRSVNVLKSSLRTGVKAGWFRNGLVVFQFTASIILIIGTFIVTDQLHFIRNKKLGYDKEQVLILNDTYLLGRQTEAFKNEMLAYPEIVSGTVTNYLPVTPSSRDNSGVFPDGVRDSQRASPMQNWIVDHDYIETMGMNIVEGRDFSREYSTDVDAAIINQAMAKQFGWDRPLEHKVGRVMGLQEGLKLHRVIGVVEDFHYETLRENIGPLVMYLGRSTGSISFRVKTEDMAKTIGLLEKKWKKFLPNAPFSYAFMDERFGAMYQSEQRVGKIFALFAVLAVFIGCLGLFGLAAFMAERRTKEIGIRKVLGATAPGIIRLLMQEFMVLVVIANVIAWPVAYFVMRRWLTDFAYRISIGAWIFVLAGVSTLFIAALTVIYQAARAAFMNPVDSLRFE